jgi:hypothetical protein
VYRRLIVALTTALVAVVASGASAGAAPGTGCPPHFELKPESFLGEGFVGKVVDVNNDNLLCIGFLPGEQNEGVFVFIDNVVP